MYALHSRNKAGEGTKAQAAVSCQRFFSIMPQAGTVNKSANWLDGAVPQTPALAGQAFGGTRGNALRALWQFRRTRREWRLTDFGSAYESWILHGIGGKTKTESVFFQKARLTSCRPRRHISGNTLASKLRFIASFLSSVARRRGSGRGLRRDEHHAKGH